MPGSRSLRIIFVAPFGLRHKSTVWARTLPLARALNHQGHSATILIPPWDSPRDSGTLVIREGVRLEHVEVDGGLPAITARMIRSLRSEAPDIVHIVKPRAYAGIVQWLLWYARSPIMHTSRVLLDVDDWERPWAAINGYPGHLARLLAWQEEWGYRHADGITAASHWLLDRARTIVPATPRLYLPNGVDGQTTGHHHGYSLRNPPRILLFSRFVETAPYWLADMWRAVRRAIPEAVLVLAGRALHAGGEGPYLHALKAAAGTQTPANVVWRGYVNPADVPELFNSVDCAIFPSDDTALLRAKCSARMATCLQHGVPVVASAVGEQAAYGGDGAAKLVPPNASPDEFAEHVTRVLCEPSLRHALGSAAADHMNRCYRWNKLAEALGEFYADILRNG